MKKYERRFREIFHLPEDEKTFFMQHGTWVKLSKNPLGSIILEWGIRYEGVMSQIAWYRNKPILASGNRSNLAVLVYFADQIGLPTDHPYLQDCKEHPDYAKICENWQIIIE